MSQRKKIIHVDMDAFFASVEVLDYPDLAGKPLVVGGTPEGRGVVAAASYPARKFGIYSAMPMSTALKKCHNLIVRPNRMSRYAEVSDHIMSIFARYTDLIEPISLDEAFLDVTGSIALYKSAENIGRAIKQNIKDELNLIASIGIADNKFLAKLASDLEKPDGFTVITQQNAQKILDPLPVSKIFGVGKVLAKKLKTHGIQTIAQLRNTSSDRLRLLAGSFTDTLLDLANAKDSRPVTLPANPKSVSHEYTFAKDTDDTDILLSAIMQQTEKVATRLRAKKLKAKTITLKLRYANFKTITRSQSLDAPTNTTKPLADAAESIFNKWKNKSLAPLRLIGFAASNLTQENKGQLNLFANPKQKKQSKIDTTLDKINKKYGQNTIKRTH